MIRLEGVTKRYGGRTLFQGFSLALAQGKTTVITGRSGSGKSTLLRLFNQLERHDEGEVVLDGLRIPAGLPPAEWQRRATELRRRTGMVFQGYHLFPHLTVLANVTLSPRIVRGETSAAAEARARELLALVGMQAAAERFPARLSGGEMQRVAIARALAMQPEVLLLDEPTSALDPSSTADVIAVIKDLRSRGITQAMVTHDPDLAKSLADELVQIG
jgi:ABC-type polar amino acid transport system ATPase subunit